MIPRPFIYVTKPLAVATSAVLLLSMVGCGQQSGGNGQAGAPASGDQAAAGFDRDQIRIVGSSTVYPFSSYAAEEFGATTDYSTPVVESTGSGGGMKLFCTGIAEDTPDITNASRQMKKSEFDNCQANGVNKITEITIGFDGIVIGQNKDNPAINFSREQVTLAVAAEVPVDGQLVDNPYKKWSDIDSSLPDREILIYGPPTSSGTRDAFEELVMQAVTKKMEGYSGEEYSKIRQDGLYVPSGENDNLIVQKLANNPDAFGIFGYSFLEENKDKIAASTIDGVKPERDLISSGEYPVSRSLFFYVKNDHIDKVDGLAEFVDLFLSDKLIGSQGYMRKLGLIPLPQQRLAEVRDAWENRKNLTKDALH